MANNDATPERKSDEAERQLETGLGTTKYKAYGQAPYVYTVLASMTEEIWNNVFFSWLSMKGYLQGMHGMNRTEMFATKIGGRVYATFIVVWSHEEQLAAWLEHGYTVEELLQSMGCPANDVQVSLQRDFS
ncbi:MAG: hypothetical protein ACYC56_11125 [Candidatus Aquicultor sp.]